MTASAASELTIFDFSKTAPKTTWQIVNDDVMGGVSASRFEIQPGVGGIFQGKVSLENDGGFASVRSGTLRANLDDFEGLRIRLRGDGQQYKFTVRAEDGFGGPLYQAGFKTTQGEWQEHTFRWKQFTPTFRGRVLTDAPPLSAAQVKSLGFLIADKQTGPFRLEINWIKAIHLP